MGQGQGCTATGDGLGALTESHGPLKTSNGAPTATGTGNGGQKNAARRSQQVGGEVWIMGAAVLGFVAGIRLL